MRTQPEIKMTKTLFKPFEQIAADQLFMETLEVRGWDGYDFKEVGVSSVLAALKDAYEAGYRAAEKKALKEKP